VTDAVAIQIITTVGTVVTVIVTGYFNRRATKEKADELHKRFDTLAQRDSGAHSLEEFRAMALADVRHHARTLHTPLSSEIQRRDKP